MNYNLLDDWGIAQEQDHSFFDSPPPISHFQPLFIEEDLSNFALLCPTAAPARERRRKLEKVGKIRTNRNSQKIYHNILKHWLLENRLESLANKYNRYFNQRIYFVLVLNEILKVIDGVLFLQSYQRLATDVRKKKEGEIREIQSEREKCEQIEHLNRVIQQIEFSVAACREFMEGNVLEAIIVVFKRNQKKITKWKEYKEALRVFEFETGCAPRDM